MAKPYHDPKATKGNLPPISSRLMSRVNAPSRVLGGALANLASAQTARQTVPGQVPKPVREFSVALAQEFQLPASPLPTIVSGRTTASNFSMSIKPDLKAASRSVNPSALAKCAIAEAWS